MSWKPTLAQVEAVGEGPFIAGRSWTYRQVSVENLSRIPFEDEEYAAENDELDPKGGIKYVLKLAQLMKDGTALPPAIGFPDSNEKDVIHLADGIHRVAAAVLLGRRSVPVVVFDGTQPRWP